MTSRSYCVLVLVLILLIGGGFAAFNYISNDFGLWRHRETARIWTLEKTSKYLLAHRYVPENFDAIMIGASVSANMDTRKILSHKVYNLSMSGGNITETAAAAHAYLKAPGLKKLMIIALHPYLTKNSGMKSFQIHEKEYEGSLYSLIPLRILAHKMKHALGKGDAALADSAAGWNNFNLTKPGIDMVKHRAREIDALNRMKDGTSPKKFFYHVDPQAVTDLDAILKLAREKKVRIAAFYYPLFGPAAETMAYTGEWASYRAAIDPLFQPGEIIVDMNTPRYDALRHDSATYYDGTHMTQQGANAVLKVLNEALNR